ncbi:hypothetical protein EZV62_000507 [Acer yangbiense]|uniref:Dienelactone hydrolase domain-containing protein n=1 Tax=Acer yangbiense TaxID=1000413 RepID=A0A5C7IS28_9ROSI|nr:hypothetical protein EZV62_000507 [Acer yangbiense]
MSGPQCCSNPPTLNPASGAGHVEKLGGLDTYVSGLSDSKLAVFLISDAFDKIAVAGFYVVVPDFFFGDPYAPEAGKPVLTWLEGHGTAPAPGRICPPHGDSALVRPHGSVSSKTLPLPLEAAVYAPNTPHSAASSVMRVDCILPLTSSSPSTSSLLSTTAAASVSGQGQFIFEDKGVEDARPVIEALKSKGISAIGAVGFCWGAKVVVQLAKREVIQAAVLCHPSLVTVDDIKGVEIPIAVLGAEIDQMSPPSLLKQFEEVITANSEVDGYVKIFPKVEHGWTVRYDVGDEAAVKPAEEAHQNMLEWFAKYVK